MNAARITLVLAVIAAFVAHVLSDRDPLVALVGFAVPVWLVLETCWRLLDPKR
jgi:hypothetical protein